MGAETDRIAAAFLDSQTTQLHADGWLELGKLPDWDVFVMVEAYFAKYHDRIRKLIERERPRWFENVEERRFRPGAVVAAELSKRLMPKGIHISAVHPSVSDESSIRIPSDHGNYIGVSGPRFYVSIMAAAMRRGPAPRPPKDAAAILWPNRKDRERPWITEVGWTMVPPSSDAQAMHADILADAEEVPDLRSEGQGRFHHFIWKPDRITNCTTGVVTSAFTNGVVKDWMHARMQRVASPCVLLDSEVCHCGGPTGAGKWTASCTVQLCSSTGWDPLQSRAPKSLLEYVCPIDFKLSGPWLDLPLESQIRPQSIVEDEKDHALRQGGKSKWAVGSLVEVRVDDDWFPAILRQRNPDKTYSVQWDGNISKTCTEAIPRARIRARRWALGSEVETQWHGNWYPSKVMKVRGDWSYRVHWAGEDTCSHLVYHWSIRRISTCTPCESCGMLGTSPKSSEGSKRRTSCISACQRKRRKQDVIDL